MPSTCYVLSWTEAQPFLRLGLDQKASLLVSDYARVSQNHNSLQQARPMKAPQRRPHPPDLACSAEQVGWQGVEEFVRQEDGGQILGQSIDAAMPPDHLPAWAHVMRSPKDGERPDGEHSCSHIIV